MARTARIARTDAHRPSAIVPANYEYVFSFSMETTDGGLPVPSININCGLSIHTEDGRDVHTPNGQCCVIGIKQRGGVFAADAGPGRCSVCGTHYVYGDVWFHVPTNEYVCLGHDCADKYSLLADRSEWEMENIRTRAAIENEATRKRNAAERAEFLAKHPGLEAALGCSHSIVRDIASRFTAYRNLSDKQIALVFKIANEATTKAAAPAEVHVAAPTGKQTFRGTIVSMKTQESAYGAAQRMTVKITTPEGTWLAWGTAPAAVLNSIEGYDFSQLRGQQVEITATLEAGSEPHFVFMKRPRGKVLVSQKDVAAAKDAVAPKDVAAPQLAGVE